ncbi:hypothetical protein [Actinomadura hibisca]|uniref:hypothetical protein n=1 Tax=Actinomadura hibisca TaxID=68565 RepID=UPI00082B73DB|nr:hypothetical protein [Actinomadura hibisca]
MNSAPDDLAEALAVAARRLAITAENHLLSRQVPGITRSLVEVVGELEALLSSAQFHNALSGDRQEADRQAALEGLALAQRALVRLSL